MLLSLHKSFPRVLKTSAVACPTPCLKWVSTITAQGSASPPLRNPEEHLRLFFNGRVIYSRLDYELSLVSALKCCSSLLAISQGTQLHALVLKSGFFSNAIIRNSLINMYAKCGCLINARFLFDVSPKLDTVPWNIMIAGYVKFGELNDARLLFEEMPGRDPVSYTTMIMGLSQNYCLNEAIEVFKDMRYAGVIPNEVTMACVISACSQLGGFRDCLMLHALVTKLLLADLVLISTNILHFYCGCSQLEYATRLFRQMPERNVVSWNVMLNGYAKAGLVAQAKQLFERMPEKDVVSWGTMMDACVQVKCLGEALSTFNAMRRIGLAPNEVMIVDLMSACGQSMAIVEGQLLHCITVKTGFDCNDFIQATIISFYAVSGRVDLADLQFKVSSRDHVESWNALIGGLTRNGMIGRARQLFDDMPERDVFSWSIMISGYAQTQQPDAALQLFHGMVSQRIQPNEITMVSVLSAIATLGSLTDGRVAHEYISNNGIPLNNNLRAALIDMYAKCGSINTALDMFYQIRDKASSVSPWNAIICGLAMHGDANLSLAIFSDLERRSIIPNSITFIGVLSACCHAGLVEQGENYFEIMKDRYNIEPNMKHYGCMVDLLGRAGRLKEAEEMVTRMPFKADVVIWGTLLAACRTHGNVEIGERAAESLAKVEASHGASRVLLSNIYADAEMWQDAFLVRRAMQSHRMKRSPGCSMLSAVASR